MLAPHLAELYGVETRVIMQAVRRNLKRFPADFAFQLTGDEWASIRSQIVIIEGRGRHPKYRPWAFTEHGVTMLASVLHSDRAIEANIAIVRAFVRMRRDALNYAELSRRIDALEAGFGGELRQVWEAIRAMLALPEPDKGKIGFRREDQPSWNPQAD